MRTLGFGEPVWANRQSEGLGRSPVAKRNQSLPLRQVNLTTCGQVAMWMRGQIDPLYSWKG